MESQRTLLMVALAFVTYLLYQQWQIDYNTPVQPEVAAQPEYTLQDSVPEADTAIATSDVPASAGEKPAPTQAKHKQVRVKTDVLDVVISTRGGDVVYAALPEFPQELDSPDSVEIFQQAGQYVYSAQSGLIGVNGPDANREQGRPVYLVAQTHYELGDADEISVPLSFVDADGVQFTKTFTFKRGNYQFDVSYEVQNLTANTLSMQAYGQLKQSIQPPVDNSSMFMPTYRGPAYSTAETRYEKYDFDDIQDSRLNTTTPGGWVAMLQHYFVSAWVPKADQENTLYSGVIGGNQIATIGYKGPLTQIAPGATQEFGATLYVGPKDQDVLKSIANGLDLTVDYGFLWWLSQLLFSLLQMIQSVVVNWGVAIIIITIVVKTVLYPLTKAQYVSMAKMRKLQPKMTSLRERYGDDRQKMSQAMMELYKKEKVNPAGGCFPLLLQMPIFLALYWVFLESYELRQAPFALWINDLSVQDPYYVLPILMGISMYVMQKMQPMTIQDPMQQKVMQFMPVMMTFFFLWFPSGLVLYWLVSNLITMAQMLIIFRGIEKKEQAQSKKKS